MAICVWNASVLQYLTCFECFFLTNLTCLELWIIFFLYCSVQPQGTYGLMQYPPLSPMQNQAAFQNMVQPVNQGSSIRGANSEVSPNSVPRSFSSTQLGSPYSPLPGIQYPGTYPGGAINNRPFANSHNSIRVQNANANSPTSSGASSTPGPQIEGLLLMRFHLFYFFICS